MSNLSKLIEKARAERPEPVTVEVEIGGELFMVEITRLDGMDWAAIMAECPPHDELSARLGYDMTAAGLLACKRFSRLLDSDGNPVEDVDWDELFKISSGVGVRGIAATWWMLNMKDPNERVAELKKALAAGGRTSSS